MVRVCNLGMSWTLKDTDLIVLRVHLELLKQGVLIFLKILNKAGVFSLERQKLKEFKLNMRNQMIMLGQFLFVLANLIKPLHQEQVHSDTDVSDSQNEWNCGIKELSLMIFLCTRKSLTFVLDLKMTLARFHKPWLRDDSYTSVWCHERRLGVDGWKSGLGVSLIYLKGYNHWL